MFKVVIFAILIGMLVAGVGAYNAVQGNEFAAFLQMGLGSSFAIGAATIGAFKT